MRLWHEPFAVPWMKTVTSLLTNCDRAQKEKLQTSDDYVTAVLEELRRGLRPCLRTARGRRVGWQFSDSFATGSGSWTTVEDGRDSSLLEPFAQQ